MCWVEGSGETLLKVVLTQEANEQRVPKTTTRKVASSTSPRVAIVQHEGRRFLPLCSRRVIDSSHCAAVPFLDVASGARRGQPSGSGN
eukprot:361311-Chlamydomonas_euryale.AAC.4